MKLKVDLDSQASWHETKAAMAKEKATMMVELTHLQAELTNYWVVAEGRWVEHKVAFLALEEFNDLLGMQSTIFYEHDYKGTIKQFKAQGYTPKGVSTHSWIPTRS